MSLILAIEADKRQATLLASIGKSVGAELVIAPTAERGLEVIGSRVPDLILTSALLSPRDDAAIAARLRELDTAASHVQTLTIPVLARASRRKSQAVGGLLGKLRGGGNSAAPAGCEPGLFAEQVVEYLQRASAERASREQTSGGPAATETVTAEFAHIEPAGGNAEKPVWTDSFDDLDDEEPVVDSSSRVPIIWDESIVAAKAAETYVSAESLVVTERSGATTADGQTSTIDSTALDPIAEAGPAAPADGEQSLDRSDAGDESQVAIEAEREAFTASQPEPHLAAEPQTIVPGQPEVVAVAVDPGIGLAQAALPPENDVFAAAEASASITDDSTSALGDRPEVFGASSAFPEVTAYAPVAEEPASEEETEAVPAELAAIALEFSADPDAETQAVSEAPTRDEIELAGELDDSEYLVDLTATSLDADVEAVLRDFETALKAIGPLPPAPPLPEPRSEAAMFDGEPFEAVSDQALQAEPIEVAEAVGTRSIEGWFDPSEQDAWNALSESAAWPALESPSVALQASAKASSGTLSSASTESMGTQLDGPVERQIEISVPESSVVTSSAPASRSAGKNAEKGETRSGDRKGKKRRKAKPAQDEWGLFDPEQCGFAALLEKLEEIAESDDAA